MIQGDHDSVQRIIDGARDVFVNEHLIEDVKGNLTIPNTRLVTTIVNVISDAGIIYLSTSESIIDLWEQLRLEDKYGVADWLMQAAVTWRIRTTTSSNEYRLWCSHLAEAYGQQNPNKNNGVSSHSGKLVCVDDGTVDRMASYPEFKEILIQNPWFTYLVTLQLSWHNLFQELLSRSELNNLRGEE